MNTTSTDHDPPQAPRTATSRGCHLANVVDRGSGKPNLDTGVPEQGGILRYERAFDVGQNSAEIRWSQM